MTSTPDLLEAIAMAADAIGADGKGLDGRLGYMKALAVKQPKLFANLLSRAVAHEEIEAGAERQRARDAVKNQIAMRELLNR